MPIRKNALLANNQTRTPLLIAFYLPQFHPTQENDQWWGKGFTEWTNVTKATPLFDQHYQPHLPTDFGFYDLRVRATRHDQINTAKKYGIDGFCYHYYWFSGKRLLHEPLDDMLADPASDMPFCLCWANENWTRRWDAAEHQILIAQKYLPDDDFRFIEDIEPFLKDPRYIRIDGKPLLIVYRPQHLPSAKKTARTWRQYCHENGIGDIYLCAALTHGNDDYAQYDFDSGLEFPPHNLKCRNLSQEIEFTNSFRGSVVDYADIAASYLDQQHKDSNVYRGVFPSWDNSARVGDRALIVVGTNPDNYKAWLARAIKNTQRDFPNEQRLIFINAWNEWAEGCHLEPDRKYQRQFLEATLAAKHHSNENYSFMSFQEQNTTSISRRTFMGDLTAAFDYHAKRLISHIIHIIKPFPTIRKIGRLLFGRW